MKTTLRILAVFILSSVALVFIINHSTAARQNSTFTMGAGERFGAFYKGFFDTPTQGADEVTNFPDDVNSIRELLSSEGIPYSSDINQGGGHYVLLNTKTKLPSVSAKSFIVADLETGDMILARKLNDVFPIASVTKLMTALVTLENEDLDSKMIVDSESLSTEGKAGNLILGEKISVKESLNPLILVSSNDTAELLAKNYGKGEFNSLMNNKAKSIGMRDTHYDDPSGLSGKTVSTAHDLLKLIQYIANNNSYIIDLSKMKMRKSIDASLNHMWYNNNPFVSKNYEYYRGGKHGYTIEAWHTVVSIFSLPLADGSSKDVAIILLKSGNIETDAKAIIKYLLENIKYI